MSINDGGPAFPIAPVTHPNGDVEYGSLGMSLRDYFAGQALQGLLSGMAAGSGLLGAFKKDSITEFKAVAGFAYGHADAMIAVRNTSCLDNAAGV